MTNSAKRFILAAVLAAGMVLFTGCGRAISNDYESVRASLEQVNPMVTEQTSPIRQKAFATNLCIPEDTAAGKAGGLSVKDAGLFDLKRKNTIYGAGLTQKVYPASTTKLMTAILLLESGLIDSTTRISSHAAATPWGSGRLAAGDVYSNRDLLYAMLLPSSNDAATAIAERVGGSEAAFVGMMNDKAGKMGFTRTHFRNPHGLDADGHYTTARELAKLTAYAYNFPEIRDCWATQCKTITSLERKRSWTLWSTNAIFNYVKNFLGGKTGTESNAGCCFTGIYTYGGSTYVTVVLGSGYGFSRWSDTKKLHRYIQDHAATGY